MSSDQRVAKLLGNRKRGLLFVISAPAGTGKTTLMTRLATEFSCVVESVSCTTRPKRDYEDEGLHYHFLTEDDFKERIAAGEFIEYAKVFGHYYGTSKKFVEEQLNSGKHVVLVIDTQGAMHLQGKVDATFIFISPPSQGELRRRLTARQTESEDDINRRLKWAEEEFKTIPAYDFHIVNDDLNVAYEVLRSIVISEEHRISG